MSKFLNEFKKFAVQGNMLDMAVGMIIGAAFTAIIKSLVDDIFNPLLGLVLGKVTLKSLNGYIKLDELAHDIDLSTSLDFGVTIDILVFIFEDLVDYLKLHSDATESGEYTFVIKTAYSIFKSNMSDGKEITIDVKIKSPIIPSEDEKENNQNGDTPNIITPEVSN